MGQEKLVFELNERTKQLQLFDLIEKSYKPDPDNQIASVYHIRPNVMIVANNAHHRDQLYALFSKEIKEDIFVTSSKSKNIKFTGALVRAKQAKDYRVVIVTKDECEGYDNTHCTHMLTSVYMSNNAKREQLRGRIHRVSQESDTVFYIKIFATKLMKHLKNNHDKASSLDKFLQQYSKHYKMTR